MTGWLKNARWGQLVVMDYPVRYNTIRYGTDGAMVLCHERFQTTF
jgi:hypothetical protein